MLDTGPLLAALDWTDAHHGRCRDLLANSSESLVIPAPVLVELDYWIRERLSPSVILTVLSDVMLGAYRVEDLTRADPERIGEILDEDEFEDVQSWRPV